MIYILPGMGADKRMYTSYESWNSLPDTVFLDWTCWDGEKTLNETARKFISVYGITKDDIICGSSLGGMIALELAYLVKARAAMLIGSAVSPQEINSFLLKLAPLAKITPVSFIQTLTGKSNANLIKMFNETDDGFIKAMCLAIREWPGVEGVANLQRIHGRKDKVIHCPEDCYIIEKAGHLAAMTHPEECVKILKKIVETL